MSASGWDRKVFRVRRLPDRISTPAAVSNLLSRQLKLPSDHVVVHSVARAAEIFGEPLRTATLQMKSIPRCLEQALASDEWLIPVGGNDPAEVLVLDTHFEGITVLHDPAPGKHQADCIAISGLASHPFGSWQPHEGDKSFMWIRDALPASLPMVRTVIYGYGSKLLGSNSFQSIGDMARTLILHLRTGGWHLSSSRPLVFLAHSLGGIVLKEAIVQMAGSDGSISGILSNVRGAIMFGVPSLGMEQSHLLAMVDGQPNQALVEDLSRYCGSYVRQLHKQFEGLLFLRRARLLWAYETEESPVAERREDGSWGRSSRDKAALVSPHSATSNYFSKESKQTDIIPINKDHSNMVKFTPGDSTLNIIIALVAELCSMAPLNGRESVIWPDPAFRGAAGGPESSQGVDLAQGNRNGIDIDDAAIKELLKVFSSVEDMHHAIFSEELDFRIKSIDDTYKDTFNWVFDLPTFSRWLQEGSGLFWIHGKPGSGKSTLMKHIFLSEKTRQFLHNWQGDAAEITAGFFFHYRGSTMQKSFEGVLRSLILQILAHFWNPFHKSHKQRLSHFEAARLRLPQLTAELKVRRQVDLPNIIKHLSIARNSLLALNNRVPNIPEAISNIAGDTAELRGQISAIKTSNTKEAEPTSFRGKRKGALEQLEEESQRRESEERKRVLEESRWRAIEERRRELQSRIARLQARITRLQDRINDLENRKRDLEDQERRLLDKIQDLEDEVIVTKLTLAELANDPHLEEYNHAPETKFLGDVTAVFQSGENSDRMDRKLERTLHYMLNQTVVKIDLVLFFDALDEYDGNTKIIGRFMKDLLSTSPLSGTRVKVCLSSRSHESFKVQFISSPSFALQDYTKSDIQAYVVGALNASSVPKHFISRLATTIIGRANGVFLWVKLAVGELLEIPPSDSGPEYLIALEGKLKELPGDLFRFYAHIVERISKQDRGRAFTLLELLVRHNGPSPEMHVMRDAVLLSECTSVAHAIETLKQIRRKDRHAEFDARYSAHGIHYEAYDPVRTDIHTWSGGLVEIKPQGNQAVLQLMHQTVHEFVMGLSFKRIVVGDLAAILHENGHTFHMKHLMEMRISEVGGREAESLVPQPVDGSPTSQRTVEQISYHAERSELTTGKSHFDYLFSAPHDRLPLFKGYITGQPWSQEFNFLTFATSFGLTLCLRDWIESRREKHAKVFDPRTPWPPLLSSLIFARVGETFHNRYLIAAELLLENGFGVANDPSFFSMVLAFLQVARSTDQDSTEFWAAVALELTGYDLEHPAPVGSLWGRPKIPASTLASLAKLALSNGQDPNASLHIRGTFYRCRPLHIATPHLAKELIRHGADATLPDSDGRAPVSWVLEPPPWLPKNGRLNCAERYEMCKILIEARGLVEDLHVSGKAVWDSLAEFEKAGHDMSVLSELSLRVEPIPEPKQTARDMTILAGPSLRVVSVVLPEESALSTPELDRSGNATPTSQLDGSDAGQTAGRKSDRMSARLDRLKQVWRRSLGREAR
ncbi:hypothetical protein QBC34DRAFT_433106 [Podospora aff. communis PSN243]|uniref:Nephrocystin 3-like N-terminal domain-containing protein n=1 Tax=Podospora aff. communis PSN243 TaxID=3040156 RepID=A0AAV9H4B8_9PEZI|nr:hypothetical protein QBC34DRAFT_433106 [Podospora aff. communis PSN243]